jgi:hypothetical protein
MKLDQLLEFVFVMDPGEFDPEVLGELYAVGTDDDGLIAYFLRKNDAYRFRLDYINRLLNP